MFLFETSNIPWSRATFPTASLLPCPARYAPKPGFQAGGTSFSVVVEAMLIGHEDWVHSVAWQPSRDNRSTDAAENQRPCLLSASMDRTMAIWRPDTATGAVLPLHAQPSALSVGFEFARFQDCKLGPLSQVGLPSRQHFGQEQQGRI